MASYATTDQLRIRIQQRSPPTVDQLNSMEEIIEASSRAIDRFCKRVEEFGSDLVASVKYFTADGSTFLRVPQFLEVDEVAVKTSATAAVYTVWTKESAYLAGDGDWHAAHGDPENPTFGPPGDLILVSPNGSYAAFPDGAGAPVVMITAIWGATGAVPADIREACLMQAAMWLKKFQGSMASELGPLDFAAIKYRRGLDSGVKQILIDGGWVTPLYGGA